MIKIIATYLLRLSLLSVIFFGSCVGPGVLYIQSPKWQLQEVDIEKDRTFFIAYLKPDSDEVEVDFYRHVAAFDASEGAIFKLPKENYSKNWAGGGSASVTANTEADGSQLVQVFAIGDTPWASLSEYRVMNDQIHPLRHGASNHWFILGMLFSPVITWLMQKPVRALVDTLLRNK